MVEGFVEEDPIVPEVGKDVFDEDIGGAVVGFVVVFDVAVVTETEGGGEFGGRESVTAVSGTAVFLLPGYCGSCCERRARFPLLAGSSTMGFPALFAVWEGAVTLEIAVDAEEEMPEVTALEAAVLAPEPVSDETDTAAVLATATVGLPALVSQAAADIINTARNNKMHVFFMFKTDTSRELLLYVSSVMIT